MAVGALRGGCLPRLGWWPSREQRAQRGDECERLVDHHMMLGLGDLDVGSAGSNEAQQIGGVLGLEQLRLPAADERQWRTRALDHRDRIEPPKLLPEMWVEAQ